MIDLLLLAWCLLDHNRISLVVFFGDVCLPLWVLSLSIVHDVCLVCIHPNNCHVAPLFCGIDTCRKKVVSELEETVQETRRLLQEKQAELRLMEQQVQFGSETEDRRRKSIHADVQSLQFEKDRLQSEVTSLENTLKRVQQAFQEEEQKREEMARHVETLQAEKRTILHEKDRALEEVESARFTLEVDNKKLKGSIVDLTSKNVSLTELYRKLEAEFKRLKQTAEGTDQENEELRSRLNEAETSISELEQKHTVSSSDVSSKSQEMQRLRAEREALRKEVQRLRCGYVCVRVLSYQPPHLEATNPLTGRQTDKVGDRVHTHTHTFSCMGTLCTNAHMFGTHVHTRIHVCMYLFRENNPSQTHSYVQTHLVLCLARHRQCHRGTAQTQCQSDTGVEIQTLFCTVFLSPVTGRYE